MCRISREGAWLARSSNLWNTRLMCLWLDGKYVTQDDKWKSNVHLGESVDYFRRKLYNIRVIACAREKEKRGRKCRLFRERNLNARQIKARSRLRHYKRSLQQWPLHIGNYITLFRQFGDSTPVYLCSDKKSKRYKRYKCICGNSENIWTLFCKPKFCSHFCCHCPMTRDITIADYRLRFSDIWKLTEILYTLSDWS